MQTRPMLTLLGVAALSALAACDARQTSNPTRIEAVPAAKVSATQQADPSVPTTTSVLTPAPAASSAVAQSGRSNKTLTRAEESTAMPLPGQNNDHSAPLAKPASAP